MVSRMCDPCMALNKENNATSTCLECEECLCSACSDHHRTLKATKSHTLLDVKSELRKSFLSEIKCDKHPSNEVDYFCVDHNTICCRDCLPESHRCCETVLSVVSASKNAKDSEAFRECEYEVRHLNETYSNVTEFYKRMQENTRRQAKVIRDKITKLKSALMERATAIENNVMLEVDDTENKILKNIRSISDDFSSNAKEAVSHLDEIQFIKSHGTDKQAFLLCHHLTEYVNTNKRSLTDVTSNMKEYTINFEESVFLPAMNSFGEVNCEENLVSFPYKPLKQDQAQSIIQKNKRNEGQNQVTSDASSSSCELFTLDTTFSMKGVGIEGLAITSDGKIIAPQYNVFGSSKLHFYTIKGELIKSINISSTPTGVVVFNEAKSNLAAISISGWKEECVQLCNTELLMIEKKLLFSFAIKGMATTKTNLLLGSEEFIYEVNIDGKVLRRLQIQEKNIKFIAVCAKGEIWYKCTTKLCCIKQDESNMTVYESDNLRSDSDSNFAIDGKGCIYLPIKGSRNVLQLCQDDDARISISTLESLNTTKPFYLCFSKTFTQLAIADNIGSIAIYNVK